MPLLNLLEINAYDIENLNEYQSTKILEKLFQLELLQNNLNLSFIELCTEPKKPDEGIDALIKEPMPDSLDFIPSGKSIFQFKATESYFNVDRELFHKSKDSAKTEFKPLIYNYFREGANYVLINTKKKLNSKDKNQLKERILSKIKYVDNELNVNIYIYDVDDIARWCNKFVSIKLEFGKLPFAKSFFEWKVEIRNNLKTDLILTDNLNSIIWNFLKNLKSLENSIRFFRVLGSIGIGRKTLINETLDKLPERIQLNIIVIDLEITNITEISKALYYYAVTNGILILLNCDDNTHHRITKMLDWSKIKNLKLITVNPNIIYDENKIYDNTDIIKIPKWSDKDIEQLIDLTFEGINQNSRYQIVKFTEGIPQIALNLIEIFKENKFQFREFLNIEAFCKSIVDYLINESHFERVILMHVLIGFSLFSSLGWYTLDIMELNSEGKFAYKFEENKNIFCEIIDLKDQKFKVEQITIYLTKFNILKKRGRFIYLSPRSLAIYLLTNFLEKNSFFEYFQRILSSKSNHFLSKFIERLVDLASENIGEKVLNYVLESEYYSSWIDFNDTIKSELFLNFSKIDNKLTVNRLDQLLQQVDFDDLKTHLTNRRNLVYALEHIIWFSETFSKGMNILLKLSLAENESYANNATNLFADKFSIYLPGTEASLDQRISYIRRLNDSDDIGVIKLVLSSLRRLFGLKYFSRSVSAEIQGFKSLPKEYAPKNKEEINNYIKNGFNLLYRHLASSDLDVSKEALDILTINFSTFYDLELWDKIEKFFEWYIEKSEDHRFEILNLFKRFREREYYKISHFKDYIRNQLNNPDLNIEAENKLVKEIIQKIKEEIQNMDIVESKREQFIDRRIVEEIEKFRPKTTQIIEYEKKILSSFKLLDEIQKYIESSPTDWIKEGMNYEEYLNKKGEKVAQKIKSNEQDYDKIITYLMQKDGMHLFYIAWNLGKLDPHYENREKIINIFLELSNRRKVEFITGYFTEIRLNHPEGWIEILKEIEIKEGLTSDLFNLALKVDLSSETIKLIKKLFNEKIIDQDDLIQLGFGNRVIKLNIETYKEFAEFYFNNVKHPLETKRGMLGDHLLIFERYINENEGSINEIKDILLKVLIDVDEYEEYEVIDEESDFKVPHHINLSHLWKDLVLKLIKTDNSTIKILRKKILDSILKFPMLSTHYDIQEVFIAFTNFEKKDTWDDFNRKFIDGSEIYKYFQFYFDYNFLKLFPDDWIIDLCMKNPDEFPQIIADIININLMKFENPPSIIINLLEYFPDNQNLSYSLSSLFDEGVRMYMPGRSSEFPINTLKKLKNWKSKSTSTKFSEWLNKTIEYQMREVERLKIKDEEEFSKEHKEDLDEFYERERWLNSIKEDYQGKLIAFAEIDNKWTVIASAEKNEDIYTILDDYFQKFNNKKDIKVHFREF